MNTAYQMAVSDFTLALIQVIAFVLPAWAIMVQIFARLMKETNLDESPKLIPLYGVGITLAIVSFYLLALAVLSTLVETVLNEVEQGASPLVVRGAADLVKAQTAFLSLGLLILVIAAVVYFNRENGYHVAGIAILAYIILNIGSSYLDIASIVFGVLTLVMLDLIFIHFYWDDVRDRWRRDG